MKIGVFDSGIGGLSVAKAIRKALPSDTVIYKHDAKHVPYGDRTADEILSFVMPILQEFVDEGCEVIVIACNTVSTLLITELRARFAIPFIALEPMVKPAASLTQSGIIAVCATPATLASPRYARLKQQYAKGVTVLQPDCSNWSYMIEHNQVDDAIIAKQIEEVLKEDADVIVLACTHYHWIEEKIRALAAGRAEVLQPEQAIVRQLRRIMETINTTGAAPN